jgi:hypothetical protein
MAKQTFTTGQVLTAAQMTSLQQTAMGGGSATAKTVSYVLVAADAGTTVIMNAAGSTTITVNTSLFAAGDTVLIQNIGAGTCTVTAGTATVSTAGSLALTQYEAGILYFTATGTALFHDYVQAASNPLTTTGDMIYSSSGSTQARLGIGSTSQVLTVSGGIPAWATPTAAGANFTLLNTGGTALTAAQTITVSGISGASKILLVVDSASSATASSELTLRLNTDTGNNYYQVGSAQNATSTYSSGVFFGTGPTGAVSSRFYLCAMGTSASNAMAAYAIFDGCNSSGMKIVNTVGVATGTNQVSTQQGGFYNSASTISSISLISSVGNFDAGTMYVYTSA